MTQPPGWYPDGNGAIRFWNGTEWTEHVAPMPPTPPAVPPFPTAPIPLVSPRYEVHTSTTGAPWFRQRRVYIPAAILAVLIVVGAIANASAPSKKKDTAKNAGLASSPRTPANTPSSTEAPLPTLTSSAQLPSSASVPSPYDGTNLASAITEAKDAGLTPYDLGGGAFGIIITSHWTVCFSATKGNAVTFYAAKNCTPDSDSQAGSAAAPADIGTTLIGQNLAKAESELGAKRYGFNEIGGGDLGIVLTSDWTVCYATVKSGVVDLFAAKDCTPEVAN